MLAHNQPIIDFSDGLDVAWGNQQGAADRSQISYVTTLKGTGTETIDISPLLVHLGTSIDHDVNEIEDTSLGKLLQALPIPSLLIGVGRTVVFANQAWNQISPNYAKILHRPFHGLFPDPSASQAIQSMTDTVFLTRKSQVIKGVLQIDEKRMWGRVHFKFLRMGEEKAILVLVEDLTAEKQQLISHQQYQASLKKEIADREAAETAMKESEEQMRTLIEVSPVGMAVIQESFCVYANSAFSKLFDYDNGDTVLGRPMEDLIDRDTWELLSRTLQTSGPDGLAALSLEGRGVRRSGEKFEITVWHRGIHYFGEPALMIFVADTGEAKALRSQLLQAQKMEAVGTLAGGIAHDFNNILTVIQGSTELILLTDGTNAVRHAEKALKACRRGADMVQRLLAFSRKGETCLRPLKINHAVAQFRALLERMIPKMISIELRLAEDAATIKGDQTQIEQILFNLALNAKDAMPDGGTVTIETRNVNLRDDGCEETGTKGPYVLLSVSDTGHGIETGRMDHIFEPFFTTKGIGKGSGLGLSTVHWIVQQHGGHIRCHSEPGKGATFRIYFPITEEMEPIQQKIDIEATSAVGNETILLVDDEAPVRELAQEVLEDAGYTVLTADDGDTALATYQKEANRISLVILDLVMPHMNGRQCLEKLVEMNPQVKVLLCSGYSADGNMNELLQSGAAGIVKKPYSVTEMLSTIRTVLSASHAEETPSNAPRSPVPEKKRIDALEALLDLHKGMTHEQLMAKYGLTQRGLKSLLIKLQKVRDEFALCDADLDRLGTDKNEGEQTKDVSLLQEHKAFSGNVHSVDLLEIFHFTTYTGRQAVLEVFSSDGRKGQVFIDKGDVKHAVCDDLQGEEALYECLSFESGSFVSHPWSEPEVTTIGKPGDFMLMEAARRRDEARAVTQRMAGWDRG